MERQWCDSGVSAERQRDDSGTSGMTVEGQWSASGAVAERQ